MIIYIIGVFLAAADVRSDTDAIFSARRPEQIALLHRQEQEVTVTRQRCDAELKNSFVPIHCFSWLRKADLGRHRRRFLEKWFSEACEKSVRHNFSIARFHFGVLEKVDSRCRRTLIAAVDDWLYRAQKEGNPESLRFLETFGSKFESVRRYEQVAAPGSGRHQNRRSLGRRLN